MYDEIDDQPNLLNGAKIRARELHPNATVIEVQTTDQDYYGFDLVDIKDADGQSVFLQESWQDTASDELYPFLRNLRWNGVVGEARGGFGEIAVDLPENPTFELDFTVAHRFQGSLTAEQIRAKFGMEPGELLALLGSHVESLQAPLAELRYGKQAKGGPIHKLTNATVLAPKRRYRKTAA